MMDVQDFRAQLEQEYGWRTEELRYFHNLCEGIADEEEKKRFRRAIVLLLYSHFEGYCKFALTLYVTAINKSGTLCRDANVAIVAATLSDVFQKLRDGTGKAPEFRNPLPDDSKLHRFARDREFVERSAEIMNRPVEIPDKLVDTESNLKPIVLRKNLYRLGLAYDQFEHLEKSIDKLLELRNKIAHGETKGGVEKKLYDSLQESAYKVMSGVTTGVTRAISEKVYLASPVVQ